MDTSSKRKEMCKSQALTRKFVLIPIQVKMGWSPADDNISCARISVGEDYSLLWWYDDIGLAQSRNKDKERYEQTS